MTVLRIECRQFAATTLALNLPYLHMAPPLGMTPSFVEICGTIKRVPWLSCGIVCVILCLTTSVEHRLVTDGWMDAQTDKTHDNS